MQKVHEGGKDGEADDGRRVRWRDAGEERMPREAARREFLAIITLDGLTEAALHRCCLAPFCVEERMWEPGTYRIDAGSAHTQPDWALVCVFFSAFTFASAEDTGERGRRGAGWGETGKAVWVSLSFSVWLPVRTASPFDVNAFMSAISFLFNSFFPQTNENHTSGCSPAAMAAVCQSPSLTTLPVFH